MAEQKSPRSPHCAPELHFLSAHLGRSNEYKTSLNSHLYKREEQYLFLI